MLPGGCLLEELMDAQETKKFPFFVEPEMLLLCQKTMSVGHILTPLHTLTP
jgi:hypothetical protein